MQEVMEIEKLVEDVNKLITVKFMEKECEIVEARNFVLNFLSV